MRYSRRERISHVLRRLGMSPYYELSLSLASPADAVAAALDLSTPVPTPPHIPPPATKDDAKTTLIFEGVTWWFERMGAPDRLIEERLVWFWHDHFATGMAKVRYRYLMWVQHLTIRNLATGNFADLLRAITSDPAMLIYLDGIFNRKGSINENYGREVMELFTMGNGHYTEADVVAAARSFSGWAVNLPTAADPTAAPWESEFVPTRFDDGTKTLLGVTGPLGTDEAIDVLLDQPATAEFIATKLHTELVGYPPPRRAELLRLAAAFRQDYEVMDLVEAIVDGPEFLSNRAVRARVRNPIERTIGLVHAFTPVAEWPEVAWDAMRNADYFLPMRPPNVAGFPSGEKLLSPNRLVHGFDLLAVVDPALLPAYSTRKMFRRLGIWDVSDTSRQVVDGETDPVRKLALAVNSPEYLVA